MNSSSDTAIAKTGEHQQNQLSEKWYWSYKPTIVYKQQTAEDWLADYRPVLPHVIDTVELFWKVYSSVPTLASLDFGNIYSVFRNGILPSWEDKSNEDGYSVLLYLNKHVTNEFTTQLYQQSLLTLIGNSEWFCEHLNGCTIERKTGGNKIAFWLSGSADSSVDGQSKTAMDIVKAMRYIHPQDVTYADEEGRVEWRDAKFSPFKVVIKCMSHKKRAAEPVQVRPPRDNREAPPQGRSRASSSNRPAGNKHQVTSPGANKNPWNGSRNHR